MTSDLPKALMRNVHPPGNPDQHLDERVAAIVEEGGCPFGQVPVVEQVADCGSKVCSTEP